MAVPTRSLFFYALCLPVVTYLAQLAALYIKTPTVNAPPALINCSTEHTDLALQHFKQILTYETVSDLHMPLHVVDPQQFEHLWGYVYTSYPEVHSQLSVEQVGEGNLSRLYTWQGADTTRPPVLFVAHVDVVPVPEETLDSWSYPPFAGEVSDGFVWGRGAIDVKFAVVAQLEAITQLLQQGFRPQRTLLFAYGHDEEVGGKLGAAKIGELLKERYGRLEVVIDEGTVVLLDGLAPFTSRPVALVATGEKGTVDVKVRVTGAGGHSSMPPRNATSTVEVMGRLIAAFTQHKLPLRLTPPVTAFLKEAAALAPLWSKPLLMSSDVWPISQLLAWALWHASQQTAANVRTTVVPTIIHAGVAANVLPATGEMNLNFRLLPGDTPEDVISHVKRVAQSIGLGKQVEIVGAHDLASHIQAAMSNATGRHFALLKQAIQETWRFDDKALPVLPTLMNGHTDSKHHAGMSLHGVLRFCPYAVNASAGERDGVHGNNERLRLSSLPMGICTYQQAIRLFGALVLPVLPTLLSGGTDSKHYAQLTAAGVLRFLPVALDRAAGEVSTIHGVDERARIHSYNSAICMYSRAVELFAGL